MKKIYLYFIIFLCCKMLYSQGEYELYLKTNCLSRFILDGIVTGNPYDLNDFNYYDLSFKEIKSKKVKTIRWDNSDYNKRGEIKGDSQIFYIKFDTSAKIVYAKIYFIDKSEYFFKYNKNGFLDTLIHKYAEFSDDYSYSYGRDQAIYTYNSNNQLIRQYQQFINYFNPKKKSKYSEGYIDTTAFAYNIYYGINNKITGIDHIGIKDTAKWLYYYNSDGSLSESTLSYKSNIRYTYQYIILGNGDSIFREVTHKTKDFYKDSVFISNEKQYNKNKLLVREIKTTINPAHVYYPKEIIYDNNNQNGVSKDSLNVNKDISQENIVEEDENNYNKKHYYEYEYY